MKHERKSRVQKGPEEALKDLEKNGWIIEDRFMPVPKPPESFAKIRLTDHQMGHIRETDLLNYGQYHAYLAIRTPEARRRDFSLEGENYELPDSSQRVMCQVLRKPIADILMLNSGN